MEKILIVIVLCYMVYELQNYIRRHLRTKKYYKKAKEIARRTNKKIMVLGDPCCGNVLMSIQKILPNCSHGDVTIDLFGCNQCDKMDINNIKEWGKYGTNEYVILDVATLSFGKDLKDILGEIKRISGGDFLSTGGSTTPVWKYIGSKQYSRKYPNSLHHMIYKFNSSKNKYYQHFDLHTGQNKKIDWYNL
jgi:hypothetical protein